jgi:hypothetical protein
VDYAIAQREQATALYREQALSAFRDVEDQLSALRVLEDEAAVQQRAVDAAKRSTGLSLLRYKRGLAQYLEVLTNQTIELDDERTPPRRWWRAASWPAPSCRWRWAADGPQRSCRRTSGRVKHNGVLHPFCEARCGP